MESSDAALQEHADFLVRNVLKPGMRVLDFGAGIGTLGEALKQRGFETDGFEYSKEARETAYARFGVELYATVDQFEKGRYDLITMVEVIEHLTAPWETLQTLRECLAPGGRIYITTPNRNGLQARLHGARWREAKPFHLMLFNARVEADASGLRFHRPLGDPVLAPYDGCDAPPLAAPPVAGGLPLWRAAHAWIAKGRLRPMVHFFSRGGA